LIRPARKDEPPRRGARQLRSLRQIIESVNDTLKGQLSLEQHGGHSPQGVTVRILQRLLALLVQRLPTLARQRLQLEVLFVDSSGRVTSA
jgi:hypothetical protein